MSSLESESVDFAKKYLEDVLSFFGLNTDIHASVDGEVIQLSVPSTHLNGFLIGQHGDTMRALQAVIGAALKNSDFTLTRVNVDIADYKKQRADRLRERAEEWVKQVRDGQADGGSMALQPMNSADRRVVHQLAAEYGVLSESAGVGRDRHVVLRTA